MNLTADLSAPQCASYHEKRFQSTIGGFKIKLGYGLGFRQCLCRHFIKTGISELDRTVNRQ